MSTSGDEIRQEWRDSAASPGQRADSLLGMMTFEEKVGVALGDFETVAHFGVPPLKYTDGPMASAVRTTSQRSRPHSKRGSRHTRARAPRPSRCACQQVRPRDARLRIDWRQIRAQRSGGDPAPPRSTASDAASST
jgi:hypothetical protein